jgi:hypothetical protein
MEMKIIHEHTGMRHITQFFDDYGNLQPLLGNDHVPIYGIELEVESTSKDWWHNGEVTQSLELFAARVIAGNDNLRCGHDSSLVNGFEITTIPGSLGYYTNVFDWSFLDVIRDYSKSKIDEIGEKGFHIHINKSSFQDEEHMVRFAEAITTDVLNGSYMFLVDKYCRPEVSSGRYCDRYVSVNLQNSRTVEVRCFIPTTDKQEIINYIKYMGIMQGETK